MIEQLKPYYKTTMKSPVGELTLVASDKHVYSVFWATLKYMSLFLPSKTIDLESQLLKETKEQLNQYFLGERKHFDLPLFWSGTAFQNSVWQALTKIPYGETKSYSELSEQIKNPKAVRAVGMANGRNPLAIIVPCHRVVGKNGSLTGFSGGLQNKDILLKLEEKYSGRSETKLSQSENLSLW